MSRTLWRGVTLDGRTALMLGEVERITGMRLQATQGSYSRGVAASAGTHAGGGAVDLSVRALTAPQRSQLVEAMRRVGFAAWLRTRAQGFSVDHVHGVAVGCPDLAPAAARQVADYHAGRNGLAGRGPDDGPRAHAGATWETYTAGGDDDMTPEQARTLDGIAWLVGQIKAQTDQINPRLMGPLDQTAYLVGQSIAPAVADLRRRLAAIEQAVGVPAPTAADQPVDGGQP